MNLKILIYAFGIWLLLAVFFIINGAVRNFVYSPVIGEWEGHVVSSVIGVGFIFFVTYLFLKYLLAGYSTVDLILIRILWLSLTVVFEFGFGHYVVGHSWEKLLADYNVAKRRIWSLVLISTSIAPYIIGKILNQ